MATVTLGNIKFNWKGPYNNSTAYVVDDVVSSGGSSYICILASTGNAVSNGTYWQQMSAAGSNGTNGTDLTTTLTTQGDIVYRDGSGLARLGAGTSGQFLKTQGTGANPVWGTVSSEIVKLAEAQVTSSTGSINFDVSFDDSTYMYYRIFATVKFDQGARTLLRIRQSGSNISNSDYRYVINYAYRQIGTTTNNSYTAGESTDHIMLSDWKTESSDDFAHWQLSFGNFMQNTGSQKPIGFNHFSAKHTSGYYPSQETGTGYYNGNNNPITGFFFYPNAGNFTQADIKCYGFKR